MLRNLVQRPIQIALIGRPQVGKSTIMQALFKENLAIADTEAGGVHWNFRNHVLRLMETSNVSRAITKSDVVILVVDGKEAVLRFPSRQECKMGNDVIEAGKCLLIVVNKWDLVSDQLKMRKALLEAAQHGFRDLKGIQLVFVGKSDTAPQLETMLGECVNLYRKWNIKVASSKLNAWLETFVQHYPPPWRDGQKQYPKFITQTRVRPPTFSLYTNTFGTFPDNYLRQMKELIREEFGIKGVPLRVDLRSTLMPKPGKALASKEATRWTKLGPKQAQAVKRLRKNQPK